MTLFGVGLILAGCVLLASAFVGASRARQADRAADELVEHHPRHVAPPRIERSALLAKTMLLSVVRPTDRGSRLDHAGTYDRAGRETRGRDTRDITSRNITSRNNASRASAGRDGGSRDSADRNVAGRNRRDPYRRNPPSPPPPARRLPVSQLVTRENAPVRQPPRR
jgi:hypothetical protein